MPNFKLEGSETRIDENELINSRGRGRIRCPACGMTKDGGALGPWISPDGTLVCTYGVCRRCADEVQASPMPLRTLALNRVERRLIEWFPMLLKRLPAGYRAHEEGESNS